MNSYGYIKEVDKLGRIVIPKKMRELFNITGQVELIITDEGILVRNPAYELVLKKSVITPHQKALPNDVLRKRFFLFNC